MSKEESSDALKLVKISNDQSFTVKKKLITLLLIHILMAVDTYFISVL